MSFSARRPDPWATALTIAMLLIPMATAIGLRWIGPWPIIVALVGCIAARILLPRAVPVPLAMTICLVAVAAGVLAVGTVAPDLAARLYPVFMSVTMLVAFVVTLFRPPSMIERFARIMEPDLDMRGVRYTRKVTYVWVGFFALNAIVALWTVQQGDLFYWGLYNGFISYLLAGSLFAIEFTVRRRVRARNGPA
ncbi:conserved hypothetical protein [Parvibaculum lavamentivorans DS-1]|uniref:Transmembrane protein n=2 Tax=Parvibaculum lavamentivorans TaxID=256618 RepID=A7HT77_PARL1|nr:conserved hypothetical protein [Parvibaculum lavamentivorans DS-1]